MWHFLCSSSCSGVFMNLWHTSHSNIRVMRCICRWRSNMFFVLQTKLQKTHSNPGRTEAGCTGAWGRRTGGREWGRDPPPSRLPPAIPFQALSPASVRSKKSDIRLWRPCHIPHPLLDANQAERNVLGSNICLPTSLLMWAYSPDWVIPPEWRRLRRPALLLPYLSLASPHCSVKTGPQARQR